MRCLLLCWASVILGLAAQAEDDLPPARLSADQEITLLISVVENSDATFIRNGSRHDASAGADHLRLKLRRGAKYAKTAEDFIANLATKSSWSGKRYTVEFPDGSTRPLGEWLSDQLRQLRTAGD